MQIYKKNPKPPNFPLIPASFLPFPPPITAPIFYICYNFFSTFATKNPLHLLQFFLYICDNPIIFSYLCTIINNEVTDEKIEL